MLHGAKVISHPDISQESDSSKFSMKEARTDDFVNSNFVLFLIGIGAKWIMWKIF